MTTPALTIAPADTEEVDALALTVREALVRGAELREDPETIATSAHARSEVREIIDADGASYIPGSRLADVIAVDAMIDRLIADCTEIDIESAHAAQVDVVWRVKAAGSMGMVVLGTCKPVGKRERQTWRGEGPAPLWRLTLALDVWCLLTEQERWRLVHHELMHATYKGSGKATPGGRAHDIEEFAATVARYGLMTETQAQFVGQAVAREELAERWGVDAATGQGLLFATDLRAVGW
jgi:hypothetical protein